MPTTDEQYLHRAIRLAMTSRGRVEPNPMVGCVLVKAGRVIGEGFHTHFGGPHAEPTALASCTESPAGATAYVTLEPCCHTNKKTPPCAPRLIEAKIARVVLGCLDPNPLVNGNGVRMLGEAGIQVDGPLLEPECRQLIAPFLARVNFNRPYVTLKWAETADGKIAGPDGVRQQISNSLSTKVVHQLRGRCDAIAVGIGTVLADDPELTVRGVHADRVPQRMILDSHLRVPENARLVQTAATFPTTIFCTENAIRLNTEKVERLRAMNVTIIAIVTDAAGSLHLPQGLQNISGSHLLIEPGPKLALAFFQTNTADRLWVFRSPNRIGDDAAPKSAAIPDHFIKTGEVELGGDVLREYLNTKSKVFAATAESADLVAAQFHRDPI